METFCFPAYRPPYLGPAYWRDESSGVLGEAVRAYHAKRETAAQLALVIAYCAYWIDAPCWHGEEIDGLRRDIRTVTSRPQLRRWLWDAIAVGIDPL